MASKMTKAERDRRKAVKQNEEAKKKKEKSKSSSSSKLAQLVKNAIGGQKERKTFAEAFEDNTKRLNLGRKTERAKEQKRHTSSKDTKFNPLIKTPTRMQKDTSPESVGEKVQIRDEARRNPLTKTGVRMPEKMDLMRGNTSRTREEMERRSSQRELAQMTPYKWLKASRETVGLKENEKAGVGLGTIRHGTLNKNAELLADNWDRIPKENQTDASIQIIYTYGVNDQNRDMVMTAFNNASTYDKRKIMDAVVQTDGWSDVAREMRQTINNAPDAQDALMQQISEDMNVQNGNYLDTFQRAAGKAQIDQYNLQQKEDKIIADWAKENYNTVEAVKYSVMQSASGWLANTYDAVALAHSDLLNAGQQDNVTDGIGAPWRNTKNYEKFGDKVASVGTTVLHDLFRIVGLPISLLSKATYTPEEVDEITRKLMGVTDWYHEAVRNNQVALEGSNLSETQKTIAEITGMVVDQIPGIAMAVVGTPAAGMTTFGLQAGGKYGRSAYENGASIEDSVKFGLAAAAAEVATEKLFTGFGYFGKGLSSKILTDTTRKMLDNSAFKNSMTARILKRVVAGGGEATEEMIMELVQPYLERSTYDPTADGATLEEVLRSGGLGFVVAQILGLPANALGVTADVMQKYDENVRNRTFEDNIQSMVAEGLESGRISEKDAENINAQIGDLRKGKGSLMQSEAKEEVKVTEEDLDTIYANHDEAREALMAEAKTKKDGEKITARYIDENGEAQLWETMVKNGKITAVRGGMTTKAEGARYVAKAQRVASATNTAERTGYQLNVREDIVKEVSALSKAFNKEVEFIRDERTNVHGYEEGGKIYVNVNSTQSPAAAVVAHEMTHLLENTSSYKKLQDMAFRFYGSSLEDKRADIIDIYKDVKQLYNKDGSINTAFVDTEVMAAFVEEKLLSDSDSIRQIVKEDRTLAQKIVDWINNIIQKITGSKEQRFLMEARDVWNKALQEEKSNKKAQEIGAEKRYSFKGYAKDGRGMYEGSFKVGTPKSEKAITIKDLVQNIWHKEPIPLVVKDGDNSQKVIWAKYDPYYDEEGNEQSDLTKLMGGNRHGTASDQRVTLNLAHDYPKLLKEARYNGQKKETGKESSPHRNVDEWFYFINDIYYAEQGSDTFEPYRVSVNVKHIKDDADGYWVYSYSAEKEKGSNAPQTLHAAVKDEEEFFIPNAGSFNKSITDSSENDNKNFSIGRSKDAAYIDAVNRGDMETAQRMVDEAAKAAGYSNRMYHGAKGGGGFTVFRGWQYFTENKDYAERYANRNAPESLYSVYVKMEKPFDTRDDEAREIFYDMFNEYGLTELQEDGLPDWTDGYDITDYIEENDLDYDSVLLNEGGDPINGTRSDGLGSGEFVSRGTSYVIRDSAQIKSADPVTYDDKGNVIPLSERFNPKNDDIRWSIGKSSKTELNDLIKSHGTAMREVFHNRKRADHKELWDMIKDEVSHIIQTGAARRDMVDEIVRLAYETGYINNAVESEELGENTWGKGIYIPEEYKGEMASLGGLRSINGQLRSSGLFLTYNRTKKGSDERYGGLDEAYSDLQASNPVLPDTIDPAEQVEALIELFSKGSDRRTLEELDEEAYAMGEENSPYLTDIRKTVEDAMDEIATFARWKLMQDSREEGIQEGLKRGKKTGAAEQERKQRKLDEATLREFDKLNKQRAEDERKQDEATMRMHDRLIKEVYNEAKSLSAEEKRDIRRQARQEKDEIIKQRDVIARELKNERRNSRMTLNEALKQEERNRRANERKNKAEEAKKQKEIDKERREERIRVAVQEYKQNKKKVTPGSDKDLYLKNKNARKVSDEFRRNVIGYLVKNGQFVETNGEVVLDENGMEIAKRDQKTGEWDISKYRNTYTPPWGLTLLAQKEGLDKDLFYTIYSKIAEMKTARDENGNYVYKRADMVKYIGMLDLGVKQKDFLYFDVAKLLYATKPTFLKGGAIKEKAGNKRGRMIEALDNICLDMFIGATKEAEMYDAEKRINVKDILDFADIVYGEETSNEKEDFLNFFVGHTIVYTNKMLETRMYANLLTERPQNTDNTKTRIIRMYRNFKKNAIAEGEAFERMGDKLKNPLIKTRYYDAKKAMAVANAMIVGDYQRDLAGKKVGKSLEDIFKLVFEADKKAGNNKMMQELTELVNCRHDIYRLKVDKGYTGHSDRECEKIVDRISKEHPELIKVADEIVEYSRNLLKMCVDCGIISQEEYEYLQVKYPYYVPTFRVLEEKVYDRNGNVARRNTRVIKTAVGGYDDVLPLFDQLVRRTQEIVKVCKKNQLAGELAKSFMNSMGGAYIDEVIKTKERKKREGVETPKDDTEDKVDFLGTSESIEDNIIPWYSAGEQYDIFVADEGLLYGWDRILPRWSEEGWKVILRRLNAFKRAVLTQYNPTFFIKNHIKDTYDLFLYNQHAQRLPKYYLKAWQTIIDSTINNEKGSEKTRDYLNEYLSLGMQMTSVFEYDQTDPARKLKRNKVKRIFMKPFDAIDNLNFVVEQVPRLAVYMETSERLMKERAKGKNNYTDEEIRSIAGYQASDATLNFGRSGTVVKNLNTYGCTFLNAGVQGMDRARRAVTQIKDGDTKVIFVNLFGLVFKATLLGIGSGWIFDWLYGGDDEYAEAIREKLYGKDTEKLMQEYAEMSDYQRLNFILINIKGEWFKFPRGRLASFIYSFDYNGEKVRNGEMDLLDLVVAQTEMASETILPPNPLNENILSAVLDVQKNRDAWGEPIVEDYEDKGAGFHYLEYDDKTSDLAIAIADFGHRITADKETGESRVLDFSPKKLDYAIDQIFGSWSDFIRPFMDKDVKFSNVTDAVIGLAKQFYIDPTSSNRLAGDYYDLKEEFENIANAHENDSPYAVASKVFGDYTDQLKALRDEINAIGADTSLSRKERLEQISELRGQMNELYRQGILDAKDALGFAHANYYGKDGNSDLYEDWQKTSKGADWVVTTMSETAQEKFALVEKDGVDAENFVNAYTFINNATADKDENGKSINGSKKEKIINYLNSLDLTAEQKMSLYTNVAGYKVSDRAPAPSFVNGALIQPSTSNMAAPIAGGGRLTSGYGWRNCPFHGREFHQAVDIAAESGTDVGAVISGTVTMATVHGGYGNSIEITSTDENGNTVVTKYNHLLNMGVEVGDVINQGTKIGEVGSTGSSTGAHLDFRLKINNDWVDPTQYIDLEASGVVDATGYTQKEGSGGTASSGDIPETPAVRAVAPAEKHLPQAHREPKPSMTALPK